MVNEFKKVNRAKRERVFKVIIIGSLIIVSSLHFSISTGRTTYHDLFDRLYYIPVILGAFFFRLKGGITTALTAGVILFAHLTIQWDSFTQTQIAGRYFEIVMYIVVGTITGTLSALENRQRLRAEEAYTKLSESFEKAKEGARLAAIGMVSAGVAHEIRNPLGSIKGAIEIIASKLKTESEEYRFVRIIEKEIKRINRIVEDFLHFSKPRAPDLSPANLNHLLESVIDLNLANIKNKGLSLTCSSDDSPPVSFMDAGQIKQVFLNVILNSIEMTNPGGSIEISRSYSEKTLRVEISDTGPGIKAGSESRLFEPFFTTRRYGTGMGLAISRQIIEKHGGKIFIKNRDDGITGAVVTIELPVNSGKKPANTLNGYPDC